MACGEDNFEKLSVAHSMKSPQKELKMPNISHLIFLQLVLNRQWQLAIETNNQKVIGTHFANLLSFPINLPTKRLLAKLPWCSISNFLVSCLNFKLLTCFDIWIFFLGNLCIIANLLISTPRLHSRFASHSQSYCSAAWSYATSVLSVLANSISKLESKPSSDTICGLLPMSCCRLTPGGRGWIVAFEFWMGHQDLNILYGVW